MHRSKEIDLNSELYGNGVKVKWELSEQHEQKKTFKDVGLIYN